jgi:hypothetical protein
MNTRHKLEEKWKRPVGLGSGGAGEREREREEREGINNRKKIEK